MPLYGFVCRDCDEEFEELVSVSKLDEVFCPECESRAVNRQLSMVANLKTNSNRAVSGSASCASGGG